jgi:hypothetical protein
LKLKSLAVITLLVIGCSFASAQSFGFASTGGGAYCNFEQLSNVYGAPFTVWQGTDNLSACDIDINGTLIGIKGSLSKVTNPGGFAVSGVTYADNVYDAQYDTYTGLQWEVTSALKCNKFNTKKGVYSGSFSWIGFGSVSGFVFGDNFGYLSCTLPSKHGSQALKGLSTGSATRESAKRQ